MSIDYYNKHSEEFIHRTFDIDFSPLTDQFRHLIPDKATILDLGCGSGRDALYFMKQGYEVYAVDGSEKMIDHVRPFLGDRAILSNFESFETDIEFDGIWASASLLHVPEEAMTKTISKYTGMLADGGVFFMSFKNREAHFHKDGRHFTCYDEKRLLELLLQIEALHVIKVFETVDTREGHENELWINCFCSKTIDTLNETE